MDQDGENHRLRSQYRPAGASAVRDRIFTQVALGTLVTDLLANFGVRPEAAVGYSLGESAAQGVKPGIHLDAKLSLTELTTVQTAR